MDVHEVVRIGSFRARLEQAEVRARESAGKPFPIARGLWSEYRQLRDDVRAELGESVTWPDGYNLPVEWDGHCGSCGRTDGTHETSCITHH